jgi:hypothetical protein
LVLLDGVVFFALRERDALFVATDLFLVVETGFVVLLRCSVGGVASGKHLIVSSCMILSLSFHCLVGVMTPLDASVFPFDGWIRGLEEVEFVAMDFKVGVLLLFPLCFSCSTRCFANSIRAESFILLLDSRRIFRVFHSQSAMKSWRSESVSIVALKEKLTEASSCG